MNIKPARGKYLTLLCEIYGVKRFSILGIPLEPDWLLRKRTMKVIRNNACRKHWFLD